MFRPGNFSGKIFSRYLSLGSHPSKIRLQNLAGKYFFRNGVSVVNEEKVKFKLMANDWITRIILREGNYESGSTQLAKRLLSKGGLFIDIGANFGLFSCIVAKGNEEVKVISIEPNYQMIGRLIDNIQLNSLEERVMVLNAAISNRLQSVTMEQPAKDNLGTTVTRAGTPGLLSILSCPLEFVFKENNITVAELIKIDIEGNEFEILEYFPFDTIYIKNIILEFNHLSHVSFEQLRSFFLSKGFSCRSITGEELINEKQEIPENNIWFANQQI